MADTAETARPIFSSQNRFSEVGFREHEDKIVMVLSMVISAIVGLIVAAIVVVTEHLGAMLVTAGPAQRFLSPLLGSLLGAWLLFRFFPDARGSGIPQTRVALLLQDGFISLRTVVGKFLCSSISVGSGVALGREGPSVHIGAGVASVAAQAYQNGQQFLSKGRVDEAVVAFRTGLAHTPQNNQLRVSLGLALIRTRHLRKRLRLGDARFSADKDAAALEAYRTAMQIDSGNDEAKQDVARVEEVLRLDPTRRGLPVRERARRWGLILQRALEAVDQCGASAMADHARPLLKKRAASLQLSDEKLTEANKLWLNAPEECRTDPV